MNATESNGLDRTSYMGSSDAAPSCGMSPWTTALDVYLAKKGEPNNLDSLPIRFGTFAEDFVMSEFELDTGLKCDSPQQLFIHPEIPFIQCHVDFLTKRGDVDAIVECKTTGMFWDELPAHIEIQVQQQLACSGLKLAFVPVLHAARDFRVYEVEADEDLQELILEKMSWLWNRVQTSDPPPCVTPSDVKKMYPTDSGGSIQASIEVLETVIKLRKTKQSIKDLTDKRDVLEASVKTAIGEHSELVAKDGTVLATWKSAKGTRRFDAKSFKTDNPDLYEEYVFETNGSRRFLLSKERSK